MGRYKCGSHQGGVKGMEFSKGMLVDGARRSESGAILSASTSQGDVGEAAAWEAGGGTGRLVSWRPREGSKGQILPG